MHDEMRPKTFEPTAAAFPVAFTTKMRHPRDFPKAGPFINPYSKKGAERTNEEKKKIVEDNRKFREAMDLLHAKFGIEKREMVIISLDQLQLGEEVKAEDDDHEHGLVEDDVHGASLQEELLDEVGALAHDGVTKETERLVQKALQSTEIKDITKLTPAS